MTKAFIAFFIAAIIALPVLAEKMDGSMTTAQKLEQQLNVSVAKGITLSTALKLIGEQSDLTFEIDKESCRNAGLTSETRVTLQPDEEQRVCQILNELLSPIGLAYKIENEKIRITARPQNTPPKSDRSDWKTDILAKLEQPFYCDFKEPVTLEQVLKRLSSENGIDIFVDWHALMEIKVNPNTKCNFRLPCEMPVKDALTYLTRQHKMSWALKNEMLNITSEKKAKGASIIRSYYVGDFFAKTAKDGEKKPRHASPEEINARDVSKYDFTPIMDYIETMVAPESWKDGGEMMEYYPNLSLVVRQTEDVHREIEMLLNKLRNQREKQNEIAKTSATAR